MPTTEAAGQRRPVRRRHAYESHPVRRHRHGRAVRAARMSARCRRRERAFGGRRPTGQTHAKLHELQHDDFMDYSAIEAQLHGIRCLRLVSVCPRSAWMPSAIGI